MERRPRRHQGFLSRHFRAFTMSLDAVIIDLRMPIMDGAEPLLAIRSQAPNLPVVLATGLGEYDDRLTPLLAAGPTVLTTRPQQIDRLIAAILSLRAQVGSRWPGGRQPDREDARTFLESGSYARTRITAA